MLSVFTIARLDCITSPKGLFCAVPWKEHADEAVKDFSVIPSSYRVPFLSFRRYSAIICASHIASGLA